MPTHNTETEAATSAQSSLDGYWYQLKVSVLFALDLLANKQQTDQITLEPASEEDLETELYDEVGALTQSLTVRTKKLIVQCKLRSTGPWKIGEIKTLLAHGKNRTPAKDMLKNADAHYLLVTSADLDGVARKLAVNGPTQWNRLKPMPPTLSGALPNGADGRVAVWSRLDQEKVEYRINGRLVERFRVPRSRVQACIKQLEEGALMRMKGSQAGVWTRQEVIGIIEAHGGYDGVSKDLSQFVPPANWEKLLAQIRERNAIVLTGPSGTGKTTTAKALIATLREENAGITHVKIEGGPERLRDDQTTGSVIFEIEDPWGRYRAEPDSLPWNDAINEFLGSASPDRIFVITSRSDVIKSAKLTSLDQRFVGKLFAGHYRANDRGKLFDLRLRGLPRSEQISALKYRSTVIKDLALPLELDRFFGSVGLGPAEDENEAAYMKRCIDEARKQSIESAVVLAIGGQEIWEGAAVLWALLKVRKKLTFNALAEIEYDLCSAIPRLEDRLSGLASFLIAGGNFRQDRTEFSFAHPLVEAGLEQAMLEKPIAASRTLSSLLDALVGVDEHGQKDWGTETAAQIVSALCSIRRIKLKVSAQTQERVDNWITLRLSALDNSFGDDLAIAAKVGSQNCEVAELARWLEESPIDEQWFNMNSWQEPKKSKEWYDWLAAHPQTHAICDAFITRIVAFGNCSFQGDFHKSVAKLSSNLTSSFQEALRKIIWHGYNQNAETLIDGALVDLDEFSKIFAETADFVEQQKKSETRKSLLCLYNRDYDEQAVEHSWEGMAEDGHTASEILRAYIEKRRERGEWRTLASHTNLNGFLWEWLHVTRKSAKAPTKNELIALGRATLNNRYVGEYWNLVEHHYDPVVFDSLEDYLRKGSESNEARQAATLVALKYEPGLIQNLFTARSKLSIERLLELALDVQLCLNAEANEEKGLNLDCCALTRAAEGPVQEAIFALLETDAPSVTEAGLPLLSTIPANTRSGLNLAVSRALLQRGEDVAERLENILKTEFKLTQENIEVAKKAMQLAAKNQYKTLIELGLRHEFARVRVEAMNAVFFASSGPLPLKILEMRLDPSSLVRKRLVEMLKERPHIEHVPTLIDLSHDTWTPDHYTHQASVSFPIAKLAVEILREEPSIADDVYQKLVESFQAAENYDVRLELLRTMVRHGSVQRQKKLLKIAVGEGQPTLQAMTARALFIESDSFNTSNLALIGDDELASVSTDVCIWLCILLALFATEYRLLQATKKLATNPDRHVFVTLIFLTIPTHRTEAQHEAIVSFLPEEVVTCLERMVETGCSEDLACLDKLGDVQSVERVKTAIRTWYKKKPNTSRRET